MSTLQERAAAVMTPFALHNLPFGIDHAQGSWLYTDDGRKLLDFGSGIAVNNLGHNYPTVVEAAKAQLDKMVHCCHNLFHYEAETALAERIVGLMGGGYKVYFSNSGAEAVEGAVKLAKYATERPAVIAFKGSFHGRTMMCASLTASNLAYRKHYEGLMPSIYFVEYPKLFGTPYQMEDGKCPRQYFTQFDDLFKKLVDPYSVAAILMEPVQGEGGAVAHGAEMGAYFMGELKKLQAEYPCIGDLRGLGLMLGMEMVHPDGTPDRELTAKITKLALENGLFLLSCGCDKNVVRFIAPLTVSKEEIDFAMGVLHTVFAQAVGE